jgi:hypothetical protein
MNTVLLLAVGCSPLNADAKFYTCKHGLVFVERLRNCGAVGTGKGRTEIGCRI